MEKMCRLIGWQQPNELPTTLSTLMAKAMNDQSIPPGEGVLHHAEGVDLIPVFPPMGVSRMGYGYCNIIYGQIRQKSLIFFVYL